MIGRAALVGAFAGLVILGTAACGGDDAPATATAGPTATTVSPTATSGAPTATSTAPSTPTTGPGDPVATGRNIFLNLPDNVGTQPLWCWQCHLIEGVEGANGVIGPELTNIATIAQTSRPGMSAEEFLQESIRSPEAFICERERCNAGLMTTSITEDLTDEQVDALVAFLMTLE